MKKIIWPLVIALVIFGIYFGVRKYFPLIMMNIMPPNKDLVQYFPLNSDTISPITIPSRTTMDVFADLKGGLPRVMTFDSNGVMFTSLTRNGKVVYLKDTNFDLKADIEVDFLTGLNNPHGIEFYAGYFYLAESDKVSRFAYDSDTMSLGNKEILFNLPNGGRHFTRTIRIYNQKLYTSVGSSCDVCVETNPYRASILVSNLDGSDLRVFSKGLRNTVFFDFDNEGRIWGMDMGRDNLGDNLPPEELNIVVDGKDYGWPYCYGKGIKDYEFNKDENISCIDTEHPVYELPAHTAPLGTVFGPTGGLFVALHGSWNSTVPVGYKVVKLSNVAEGVIGHEDYITGFIEGSNVLGRPAGLVFDKNGNMYISDDKAGLIYVLSK